MEQSRLLQSRDEDGARKRPVTVLFPLLCCHVPLCPVDVLLVVMMQAICQAARSNSIPCFLLDELIRLTYHTFSQLEAIIRIMQADAKMTLPRKVQSHLVEGSIRLHKYSNMKALVNSSVEGMTRSGSKDEIEAIEKELKRC